MKMCIAKTFAYMETVLKVQQSSCLRKSTKNDFLTFFSNSYEPVMTVLPKSLFH